MRYCIICGDGYDQFIVPVDRVGDAKTFIALTNKWQWDRWKYECGGEIGSYTVPPPQMPDWMTPIGDITKVTFADPSVDSKET